MMGSCTYLYSPYMAVPRPPPPPSVLVLFVCVFIDREIVLFYGHFALFCLGTDH